MVYSEFKKWIDEVIDDYAYLMEDSTFDFSKSNPICKIIIELIEKDELSFKMFTYFVDKLIEYQLIDTADKRNEIELDTKIFAYQSVWNKLNEEKEFDNKEKIDNKINRFLLLWKIDGISDIEYLDDIYDNFDIETMIRIRASDFMRNLIRENSSTPNKEFLNSIIRVILTQDDKYELMAIIKEAINNYRYGYKRFEDGSKIEQGKYLPDILENGDLLNKLVKIMIKDPENLFAISTIKDVEEYEQIRKKSCLDILLGKKARVKPSVKFMAEWKKKKFALFELLYGIDFDQAENLIEKYGRGIGKIEPQTKEEKIIIDYIKSLINIMELDDELIQKMIENPEFIRYIEESEPPEIASNHIVEKDIVSMYEREFNSKISTSKPILSSFIKYEDKEIPVELYSPIDENGNFHYSEFSIFIRQEGIKDDWKTPENYRDYYNVQSAENHGDCRSFISQSQIAFWRKERFSKVGYSKTGKILYMAPWNITTGAYNIEFSPINSNWKIGKGIRFEIPEDLINNTRAGMRARAERHGEIVTDKIIKINENGMTKISPDRSIYLQEGFRENETICTLKSLNTDDSMQFWASNLIGYLNSIDKTEDEKNELDELNRFIQNKDEEWKEALRVAYELDIPLSIIDREGFAIQEEMVIQHDLELLGGNKIESLSGKEDIEDLTQKECKIIDWSRKPKLSREGLIREILIRFENNTMGMQTADLGFKYFTDEKRKDVISALLHTIEFNREYNKEQYVKDLLVIEKVIQEEKAKEQTNTGITVYKISNAYMELEQGIERRLTRIGARKPFIELGDLDELNHIIDFIYNSGLYDDNEIHSTDHIVKTTLFADVLAKKEGISERNRQLLLIASSMHDSGREGEDGKEQHSIISAEKAGKILKSNDSPFKEFNLTDEEIKMIQIIIEYHEVPEEYFGKIEIETELTEIERNLIESGIMRDQTITGMMNLYKLDRKYLQIVSKLCELLKDADALDRERIPVDSELTNTIFLHTDSAKDIRMLAFSNRLNDRVAKKLIKKYYSKEYISEDGVYELGKERIKDTNRRIQSLTKEEMYETLKEMGINLREKNEIEFIREQYTEEGLRSENIEEAFEMIKADLTRIKEDEIR